MKPVRSSSFKRLTQDQWIAKLDKALPMEDLISKIPTLEIRLYNLDGTYSIYPEPLTGIALYIQKFKGWLAKLV